MAWIQSHLHEFGGRYRVEIQPCQSASLRMFLASLGQDSEHFEARPWHLDVEEHHIKTLVSSIMRASSPSDAVMHRIHPTLVHVKALSKCSSSSTTNICVSLYLKLQSGETTERTTQRFSSGREDTSQVSSRKMNTCPQERAGLLRRDLDFRTHWHNGFLHSHATPRQTRSGPEASTLDLSWGSVRSTNLMK